MEGPGPRAVNSIVKTGFLFRFDRELIPHREEELQLGLASIGLQRGVLRVHVVSANVEPKEENRLRWHDLRFALSVIVP